MAGFGENLRREREMRGITLDEISNTTKISVRLLEALENENFSRLPGGIFTRSFIRSYANYLGLDEEHVMSEYQIAAPTNGEQDLSRFGASSNKSRSKPGVPILTWTIAILLLAGGYGIFRYGHRSTEVPVSFGNPSTSTSLSPAAAIPTSIPAGPPPQVLAPDATNAPSSPSSGASSAVPAPAAGAQNGIAPTSTAVETDNNPKATQAGPPTAAVGDASTKVVDAPPSTSAASPSSAPPAAASVASITAAEAAGSLVLQVAATQRVWVAVGADGKTVFERVLNPAEQHTLMAKNYFDVTTGNAQGTVLTLNGVTLKPLGRHGEVKTLHLTRDDLRNATP